MRCPRRSPTLGLSLPLALLLLNLLGGQQQQQQAWKAEGFVPPPAPLRRHYCTTSQSMTPQSESSAVTAAQDAAGLMSQVEELGDRVKGLGTAVKEIEAARKKRKEGAASAAHAAAIPAATTPPAPPVGSGKAVALVKASMDSPTKEFVDGASMTFLEADPFWDTSGAPQNTFRPSDPHTGRIVEVKRLTGPRATGEVCHITIEHGGVMPYLEGQSISVTPPGEDAKGRPHKARLYSIASTRYGDDGSGKQVTLCVRRARYTDPDTGEDDPKKAGVCSNYLCDANSGDEVKLSGPSGKVLLMPESEAYATDIIMIATGTGIAPYRGFIRRLFFEDTPASRSYQGEAWLFLGVANSDALLYHSDWIDTIKRFPFNFRYTTALSREQKNRNGGKMYIQDAIEEHADEVFEKLQNGAVLYMCGLKGMLPNILSMLESVAARKGLDWDAFLKNLKKQGQWRVEVY